MEGDAVKMSEAESKKIFQKRFNELLDRQHITQKEIASICRVSKSTVSTWSKGLNMPRMDKIELLANYFGLPKSHFIEENANSITLDDFTYALQNEVKTLTDMDKQILLSMAKQLNDARMKKDEGTD